MEGFFNSITSLWSQIFYAIYHIQLSDIIDIAVIAFLVYKAVGFLRETRAGQLVKGILVLMVVSLCARWFNLVSLQWLLNTVFEFALVAVAIIFQPELRRALEKVGRSNFTAIVKGQTPQEEKENAQRCIEAVCRAAGAMQKQKVGALVVFERNTLLGDIINTGTVVDAEASVQMIGNVFFPNSPLHDGAMIIRDGRIHAAGCILPLTQNEDLNSQLGTRHRAAIGMSENSDAVVLVISEETGTISVAINGRMLRNYTIETLRQKLTDELVEDVKIEKETPISFVKTKFGAIKDKIQSAKKSKEIEEEQSND